MKYCHKCGSPLSDDTVFCTQCGAKTEIRQKPELSLSLKSEQSEQKKDKRLIILLLLVIVLLLGFAILELLVFGNNSEAKLRRQLSLGERYYAELDYDRAIAAYSESLRIDPKNEEALIGIAHSYEDRGMERLQEEPGSEEGYSDLLTAVDYYKQAEEYHPDSDRLPEIQEGIQRTEEAAAYYSGDRDWNAELQNGTTAAEQTEEPIVFEVGDTYIYGTYEQDNDTSNGAEDIEWIVLDKDGDKVLLISKYVLARGFYHKNSELIDVTWETCSLRKWLNETFMETAFSADEAARIVTSDVSAEANPEYSTDPGNDTRDQVFLLSVSEVEKYFGSSEDRKCKPTEAAGAQEVYQSNSDGCCWWWLRSPGSIGQQAAFVDTDGSVSYSGGTVANGPFGVRPVIWVTVAEQTTEEPSAIEVGDTYICGTYEQDNDTSNGEESIEWIVLDKDGEKLLLISKNVLDFQPYSVTEESNSWEICSLRAWLNGPFLEAAFSAEEAEKLVTSTVGPDGYAEPEYETSDRVYLLGVSEAQAYFASDKDRMCKPTEYARAQGDGISSSIECCDWWLRSRGHFTYSAAWVQWEGFINEDGMSVDASNIGVRPVIWIEP